MSARLIVVSGPSGVGKGTLIARARQALPELTVATSATTRPRRPGEEDGREYHFLSDEEFARRVGEDEFLEHVTFAGYRYGTLRSEVERRLADGSSVMLEIDVPGARAIQRQDPHAVLVFIAPPDLGDLRDRLTARGTNSDEEIDRRMAIAREEMAAADEFGHVIVNDDVERATAELVDVIRRALQEERQ